MNRILRIIGKLNKVCVKTRELVVNADVITDTLDDLGLEAHPEKSGVLVFGKKRQELIDEINVASPRVQSFTLSFKEKETYLGMIFSQMGASDSISKTIEAKRQKCLIKAAEIKRDLADERMQGMGWLAAAGLLHTAVVMSTLSYATPAFVDMNKQQWDSLEAIQRRCLINILDISEKVTYRSLLFIMGIVLLLSL